MYATANGVKPRYDNGGTEFGLMHRDLGPGYLMFDIDRLSAILNLNLEMKKTDQGFAEYRLNGNSVKFIALFELKHKQTPQASKALDPTHPNSIARLEMARLLDCRLIVIFATQGKQPFTFYEIDTETGDAREVGTLDYSQDNRAEMCQEFWRDVLNIPRDF